MTWKVLSWVFQGCGEPPLIYARATSGIRCGEGHLKNLRKPPLESMGDPTLPSGLSMARMLYPFVSVCMDVG